MVRKSKVAGLVLPGKSYFLKNPDGFIFTYLFSSGAVQDTLVSILGKDIVITPVSIQISPMESIRSFGKCLIATAEFPQEFPGKALSIMPYTHVKKLIADAEIDYSGLMNAIHAPVGPSLSRIIEKENSGISVSNIYTDAGKFPPGYKRKLPLDQISLGNTG